MIDTRCEAKLICAKFLMLGDDLSVWDFLSSMTFPWLLMIFQSSMTFHDFSRKFYFSRFSRFSRPCGNPVQWHGWGISCKIALRWMPLDLTDDKSTLVQVMAWCHQATSHYWSQCWPRFMSPYGITRPQWGNGLVPSGNKPLPELGHNELITFSLMLEIGNLFQNNENIVQRTGQQSVS